MPLTSKGNEIMGHMKEEYGSKEGEKVFYASKNAGKISGVDAAVGAESHTNGHSTGYSISTDLLVPPPASPLENLPMTISAEKTLEHARHHWECWENPHPTKMP